MPSSLFDRTARGAFGAFLVAAAGIWAAPTAAQEQAQVVGVESSVSRSDARLRLELANGRTLTVELRNNEAFIDGTSVGGAPRGSDLDRAWREVLARAMEAANADLPQLLSSWEPPAGQVGTRLRAAFRSAFDPAAAAQVEAEVAAAANAQATPAVAPISDSVIRLVNRIGQLERMVADLESTTVERARTQRSFRRSPFHRITEGIAGVFSIMIGYFVIFAIGVLVILFGGRRYIEGVADTARHSPGRSLLVGLAATFLVVPAFFLGLLALVISIVGIPAILLWLPGFPLAVLGGAVLGYIGVAHAAGEAFAERRFYVTDWFQRGNSYYFLLTGIGLLLVFFLASQVVHMAGPWLNFISGILIFFGVVTSILAVAIGFGAVLISRAGTRSTRSSGVEEADLFTEEAGV